MDEIHENGKRLNVSVLSEEFARKMDDQDELSSYREKFLFPKGVSRDKSIYLCGNSLGLQPITTSDYLQEELKKWADYGVDGHFAEKLPWVTVDETCIRQMAQVVGAKESEVAVMNSLTVNLHLMMVAFYRPTASRYKIMIESKAFPSDYHAVKSQIKFHDFPETALIALEPREGESTLRTQDILDRIEQEGPSIALVMLSGIQFYTGEFFDLETITKAAQAQGCRVGFDLAHAVGNVELKLHDWGMDFAVWCTYKYLNSGPGGIGGCFVHERHEKAQDLKRFEGWWGHRKQDRFDMSPNFIPSDGAFGFQLSNPSVLCQAALRASLDLMVAATIPKLREKSIKLTGLLHVLLNEYLSDVVTIITPSDPSRRGCQLSLLFQTDQDVTKIHERITQQGVICDLRKPNVMRIAPCPLYNTFYDVFEFVEILKRAVISS